MTHPAWTFMTPEVGITYGRMTGKRDNINIAALDVYDLSVRPPNQVLRFARKYVANLQDHFIPRCQALVSYPHLIAKLVKTHRLEQSETNLIWTNLLPRSQISPWS